MAIYRQDRQQRGLLGFSVTPTSYNSGTSELSSSRDTGRGRRADPFSSSPICAVDAIVAVHTSGRLFEGGGCKKVLVAESANTVLRAPQWDMAELPANVTIREADRVS
jgi:hypothetical protein